jgi:hypothetical protein
MLGNMRGWVIAAGVVGLQALVVWKAIEFNQPTQPTALVREPGVLDPLSLDIDPASIVPMNGSGDGTALYRSALAEVKGQNSRYQKYVDEGTSTSVAEFPAVQKLIDATALPAPEILTPNLDDNISYAFETDEIKALHLAGKTAEQLGVLNMADHPDVAKKCFQAEFALGAKMLAERLRFYEAFDGIALLRGGAGGLKAIAMRAKKNDEVEKLAKFDEAAGATLDKANNLWKVVGSIDTNQIAIHSGDIYFFTGPQMKERMWRIESTLKLGRHKFNAGKMADAVLVNRRLKSMAATEKDPALLAAVKTADDLTLQDYRTINSTRQ